MYPAMVKKLADAHTLIEAVKEYLQDKVDNAGESDSAQERADALGEVLDSLDTIQSDLDDAKTALEGVE